MKVACPLAALPVVAEQLRAFGATVVFIGNDAGCVSFMGGRLVFAHEGEVLTVRILEDNGHFPQKMLIGGIRQLVEEACELL